MRLPPRRLVLHVGMHKTGTKALQVYLAANRLQLMETGVHYPLAGRHQLEENLYTPGHHQIAFDFASEDGSASFAAVVNEIRLVQAATVVLSSEEFLPLARTPGALETIIATSRDLGYETIAVIVLRAQPDYVQSIYSEIAKTSCVSTLDELIEQAVDDGRFTPLNHPHAFDLTYTTIVARLEAIFGVGNVIARAYRPDRGLDFGHVDFLNVVAHIRGGLQVKNTRDPLPSANERVTLLQLLKNIARTVESNVDPEAFVRTYFPHFSEAELAHPFSLITRGDRVRFLSRFADDNVAINARFGIDIPFVAENDITMSDADEIRAQEHRALLAAVLEETAHHFLTGKGCSPIPAKVGPALRSDGTVVKLDCDPVKGVGGDDERVCNLEAASHDEIFTADPQGTKTTS